jgi:prepilin-type N-terminal cleavage/methylation domain-containing protein
MKSARVSISLRRGVTLLEVVMTVIILAIVAGAMIGPSSRAIAQTRLAGAEEEIYTTLLTARSRAIATGRSHGVSISTSPTPTVTPVTLSGTTIITRTDPLDLVPAVGRYDLQTRYPGIALTLGSGSSVIVWFASDGSPELRGSNGLRTGSATTDTTIRVTGGLAIVVRAVSGLVEKQP